MNPVSVGVLGCGTISEAYLEAADRFDGYEIIGCADIVADRARAKAGEYGLQALDPDGLLADDRVELVINLTPPSAHVETCQDVLAAGKHVYVEKPLAASRAGADRILAAAAAAGRIVGSAPDTFLGAGLQTARSAIDAGRIGTPIGATAVWASGGHESWHPNPDLYYQRGGGPLFDMGPYYVTGLVSLLGPARRVTGSTAQTFEERTITSDPRDGETLEVDVPTHEAGLIDFADGTIANILMTFDTPGGTTLARPAFELYGTKGTLRLPNPNHFDGPVEVHPAGGELEEIELTHEYTAGRGAGVADTAAAIRGEWSHRTSGALGRHVLEILEGVRTASRDDGHVHLTSSIDRPDPLSPRFPETLTE